MQARKFNVYFIEQGKSGVSITAIGDKNLRAAFKFATEKMKLSDEKKKAEIKSLEELITETRKGYSDMIIEEIIEEDVRAVTYGVPGGTAKRMKCNIPGEKIREMAYIKVEAEPEEGWHIDVVRGRAKNAIGFERFAKKELEERSVTKVLIIGDFHIPDRATQIPVEFKKILRGTTFDMILCTGDFTTRKTFKWLHSLGKAKCVIGNMDRGLKLHKGRKTMVRGLAIGLIHGSEIHPRGDTDKLVEKAKEMKANILVYGHTHLAEVTQKDGVLLINPGSVTGAPSGTGEWNIPTFIILELGQEMKIRTIELRKNELNEKIRICQYAKR